MYIQWKRVKFMYRASEIVVKYSDKKTWKRNNAWSDVPTCSVGV